MRVPSFQAKVPSEGSEGSEVKVPCEVQCEVSKKFQLVKVPSEGSRGFKRRFRVKCPKRSK